MKQYAFRTGGFNLGKWLHRTHMLLPKREKKKQQITRLSFSAECFSGQAVELTTGNVPVHLCKHEIDTQRNSNKIKISIAHAMISSIMREHQIKMQG